jgi:hypothetical protein
MRRESPLYITSLFIVCLFPSVNLWADDSENTASQWLEQIQDKLLVDADLSTIKVAGSRIIVRPFVADRELQIFCDTDDEEQLRRIHEIAVSVLEVDAKGAAWLKSNAVAVISRKTVLEEDTKNPENKEREMVALLVQSAQDQVEIHGALRGVLLSGMTFHPVKSSNQVRLELAGKVSQEAQRTQIEGMVSGLIDEMPDWKQYRDMFIISSERMAIARPSTMFAARYYTKGLQLFGNKDYAGRGCCLSASCGG